MTVGELKERMARIPDHREVMVKSDDGNFEIDTIDDIGVDVLLVVNDRMNDVGEDW